MSHRSSKHCHCTATGWTEIPGTKQSQCWAGLSELQPVHLTNRVRRWIFCSSHSAGVLAFQQKPVLQFTFKPYIKKKEKKKTRVLPSSAWENTFLMIKCLHCIHLTEKLRNSLMKHSQTKTVSSGFIFRAYFSSEQISSLPLPSGHITFIFLAMLPLNTVHIFLRIFFILWNIST